MKVEIYSDVVCPWCYIGHARFARAVERYRAKGGEVEVEFRPFQLAPDAESNGELTLKWAAEKFGGSERAAQMFGRVTEVATEDGLVLDFDHSIQANTFDAHRLIRLAGEQGKGRRRSTRSSGPTSPTASTSAHARPSPSWPPSSACGRTSRERTGRPR